MPKPHRLADGRYECQNCLRKFTKNAKTYREPLFCQNSCRYEFHSQGGLSLKRIEHMVRRWIREEFGTISGEPQFKELVSQIAREAVPVHRKLKRRAA